MHIKTLTINIRMNTQEQTIGYTLEKQVRPQDCWEHVGGYTYVDQMSGNIFQTLPPTCTQHCFDQMTAHASKVNFNKLTSPA
jgi:hypothetical protein